MKRQYVYVFYYCSDTIEGVWSAVSLHRTKAGAVAAMKKHKANEVRKFQAHLKWRRKTNPLVDAIFGEFEYWEVNRKLIYE